MPAGQDRDAVAAAFESGRLSGLRYLTSTDRCPYTLAESPFCDAWHKGFTAGQNEADIRGR